MFIAHTALFYDRRTLLLSNWLRFWFLLLHHSRQESLKYKLGNKVGLLSSISWLSVGRALDWILSLSDGVPSGLVSMPHIPSRAELCSAPFQMQIGGLVLHIGNMWEECHRKSAVSRQLRSSQVHPTHFPLPKNSNFNRSRYIKFSMLPFHIVIKQTHVRQRYSARANICFHALTSLLDLKSSCVVFQHLVLH